jgi:hypothetical protein
MSGDPLTVGYRCFPVASSEWDEGAAYESDLNFSKFFLNDDPKFKGLLTELLIRLALRPGNVHSAAGWRAVLEPVIARSIVFKI